MSDFETKRLELAQHLDGLHTLLLRLFPSGEAITWRCENSANEVGKVVAHLGRGRVRVVDDRANFYTTITFEDIVRATP